GDGDDRVYASVTGSGYHVERSANRLSGGAGDDYLFGGAGEDIYFWQRGDGSDTFADKNYGEVYADVVSLGEGVTAADVSVIDGGETITLAIAGSGGGRIVLSGFDATYGPHDLLFVDGKFYDLHELESYGIGWHSLADIDALPPTGTGSGTGGTGGGGGAGTGPGVGGGEGDTEIPPLLFDLDGDGFELIAPHKSGIYFDWDGDGIKDETGWAGPDDAFLVLDRDGDGAITRADEISFGTVQGKKDPFVTDLQGLRGFDSDGDGSLDADDADFGRFGLWRDADSDAVVDAGELLGLAEAGLAALSLTGWETGDGFNGQDNHIFATADAVFADGSVIAVADLFLGYDGSAHAAYAGGASGGYAGTFGEPDLA
ncbi:MAG TPA: hypothetical protein VGW34_00580, partial [Allosphingosinicella sp.]|nr:hypothetical protein [Allosphingosinicella sp.]